MVYISLYFNRNHCFLKLCNYVNYASFKQKVDLVSVVLDLKNWIISKFFIAVTLH